MPTPEPQPGLMDIELYRGGQSTIDGVPDPVKLSSNENPHGPCPGAVEAFGLAARELHRYPPTDHLALRVAIGEAHGLAPERIICGAGSDEIIHFLCQCYAGPGDEALHTEHGFAMYRISALAAGAKPVAAPERDRTTDVDALLAVASARTRLAFVANPNNPTGTMIGVEELARLADGLPENAILVLDGAYAEFAEGYDGGAALAGERENVFMTRTFSKLYGLGGLRIGWGYGPQAIIDVLNRIRGPFNLSNAQLAAAEAAVRDRDHAKRCREENSRLRDRLRRTLVETGVRCDESYANFVLARFADEEEADACDAALKRAGIIVRRTGGYGLPNCLRITVGDEASCRLVERAVAAFKDAR